MLSYFISKYEISLWMWDKKIYIDFALFFFSIGTLGYLAPEMKQEYQGKDQVYEIKKFDLEKCDIFSLGITAIQFVFNLKYDEISNWNVMAGGEDHIK